MVSLLPAQTRRVVVIYDERLELPGLSALDASLVRRIRQASSGRVEIYREPMDLSRFGTPQYVRGLSEHWRAKYAGKQIDLVITAMGPALDFALEHGARVFPGAAIVFCGIDRRELPQRTLPDNVTGVLVKREFRPTLETALRLHPATKHIVVVGGTSEFDRRIIAQAAKEFQPYRGRLEFTYLTDLAIPALLQRLANLPPHSIVLYTTMFRDAAGDALVPHQAVERIAGAANAPVYVFVDQYIGRGVVGGYVYSIERHGVIAASLALAILSGTRPSAIEPIEAASSLPMFDWRQLRRWPIDVAQLPPDAHILFQEPSPWDEYRHYFFGALVLALVQASVIVMLIIERSARRRSETRHALATAAGAVGVWEWDLEKDGLYVDPVLKIVLGYPPDAVRSTADWRRLIHPDDVIALDLRMRELMTGKSEMLEMEMRMLHRENRVCWFLARASLVHKRGRPALVIGTSIDITERKRAEQMLDDVQSELTRVSKLSALGEFAASLAHELRQPLTSVTLNVEASLRWLAASTPRLQEIREALADAVRASRRADEMIRRNSDLFRMHSVSKEMLDVNDLVREAAELARVRLQRGRVALRTSLADNLPVVKADRIQMQQVLLNLIANAIDATQQLPPRKRRIEVTTSCVEGDQVKLTVQDNGQGLGGVDLQRLFKLSYTTKATGTGIGLSLCRSIVEIHGGRIWAEQNAGGGASFNFTIPVEATPARPIAARAQRLFQRT
jgi:PAS domain S-box-containing protein